MGGIDDQLRRLRGATLHFRQLSAHNLQLVPIDVTDPSADYDSENTENLGPRDLWQNRFREFRIPLLLWILGSFTTWLGVRWLRCYRDIRGVLGILALSIGFVLILHAIHLVANFSIGVSSWKQYRQASADLRF
jgi:hypothetical protein